MGLISDLVFSGLGRLQMLTKLDGHWMSSIAKTESRFVMKRETSTSFVLACQKRVETEKNPHLICEGVSVVDQQDLKLLGALEVSKVEELPPQLELFRAISCGSPARKFYSFQIHLQT